MNASDLAVQKLVRNLEAEGKEYAYMTGYLGSLLVQVIEGAPKKYREQVMRDIAYHIEAHAPAETV
jgi:hypothetical protein